jgi:preprotein translocase subunit SecA
VQYDDVMNRHRKATYVIRRSILMDTDISKRVHALVDMQAADIAASPLATTGAFEQLITESFPFDAEVLDRLFDSDVSGFGKSLRLAARELYDAKEEDFTAPVMREVEREIYLQILDNLWMQHLENMDHLREGIHWSSVGQRDPLVEYRRQSQELFDVMQKTLQREVVHALFRAQPIAKEDFDDPVETELTRAARSATENATKIVEADEYESTDFTTEKQAIATKNSRHEKIVKKRKAERKRKNKAKRRR